MNGNDPRSQDYGQAIEAAVDRAIRATTRMTDKEAFEEYVELALAGGATYSDLIEAVSGELYGTTAEKLIEAFGIGALRKY